MSKILKIIKNRVSLNYYAIGTFLFWFAVAILLSVIVGVSLRGVVDYPPVFSIILQKPSNTFFSTSLNLVLSVLSIVFLVVIFLIQNANQEYSTRLSRVVLKHPYFLVPLFIVLGVSVLNLSGSYFALGQSFQILVYAASMSSVVIIGSLIMFAIYFSDISNILGYLTRRIKKNIREENIYIGKFFGINLENKAYIEKLNVDTQLIASTCSQAIENDQLNVVKTCTDSLKNIVTQYLKETSELSVEDDFLEECTHQFKFLGTKTFEKYTRQKYSEDIAEAIGGIGVEISKNRKFGSIGSHWTSLLRYFFLRSLNFDRTETGGICASKLGDMTVTAIKEENIDFARSYLHNLERLSDLCVTQNHLYLAILIQSIHIQYQKIVLAYLDLLLEKGIFPEREISSVIETFSSSFNKAKNTFDIQNNLRLFAATFGVDSFSSKVQIRLARENVNELNMREKKNLQSFCMKLIEFLKRIGKKETDKNLNDLYKGFSEFLYVFIQDLSVEDDFKEPILMQLNKSWIECFENTYTQKMNENEDVSSDLREWISNFYALIVYFYKDEPEKLSEFISPLGELYTKLDEKYDVDGQTINERNIKSLYKELKLIASWVDLFQDTEEIIPDIMDILIENFEEVESMGIGVLPLLQRYGYPSGFLTGETWQLRPSRVWGNGFQKEIAINLNGENGKHYQEFHEEVKEKHYNFLTLLVLFAQINP